MTGRFRTRFSSIVCTASSIVDHDVFYGQLGKTLAGFRRTEDIKFTDESNELVLGIGHWHTI